MVGSQNFLAGVLWTLGACVISCLNDVLSKKAGMHLNGTNVFFFRCLCSTVSLLPFVLRNPKSLKLTHWRTHSIRGFLFAAAMIPWCYGLIDLPLSLTTTLSFTTPLFVTLLASFFLKEKVGSTRILATLLGFVGIMISTEFSFFNNFSMNPMIGLSLLATFLFAVLDVVNKTLLKARESILSMIFFSCCWTTLFVFPLSLSSWQWPRGQDLCMLFALGLGANALLGCLLKASSACDLSAVQPFRYTEFLLSCLLSILIFDQMPSLKVFLGMAFILPSTLYLSLSELKQKKVTMASTV